MTDLSKAAGTTVSLPAGAVQAAPHRSTAPTSRWRYASGIGLVVAYVGAAFLGNTPDANASDHKWVTYFASSGNRAALIVCAFLLVIAGLCAVGFMLTLSSRVAEVTGERPGLLPVAAASVTAACFAVGGVLNAGVAGAMAFGKLPEPGAETLRVSSQVGFPIVAIGGMFALSLAIVVVSAKARRAHLIGTGLAAFGYVAAVIGLLSMFWVPAALPMLWLLITSVALVARRGAPTTA